MLVDHECGDDAAQKDDGTMARQSDSRHYFQSFRASRRRWTTRSRPRATMVSNNGGATAWPTMATRVALMSSPAFTPASSATLREAWSQASWFHSGGAASASARFFSSAGTFSSFQNFALAASSIGNSSLKNARDQLEKSGSSRTRGRNRSTVPEN